MNQMSKRVVLTRQMPSSAADVLAAAGHTVDMFETSEPPPRHEITARARGCAGLITMLSDRVDEEFLDAIGSSLRIVANYAVGFDNIDLDACRRRGIRASNTPGVLTEATADLAWALILSAARNVAEGDRVMRSGRWSGWAPLQLLGLELNGATLGILGAGRIGSAVARRSFGFGMRVLYTDPNVNELLENDLHAERVDLDRLLAESDILSLHIPMTPEARHLIGRAQFDAMKPTAILINTARGPIVDEAALVAALRSGVIAAAGLDVYENEPRMAPGLTELPNIVVLPHLGSATTSTRSKMAAMAAENVVAVLAGREPPNAVA
jgi:glyoxylate reductase